MREKAAAAAMLTPVTKAKIALAMMVATASRAGQPAADAVRERVEVGRGAAFGEEIAHQHEQRDDRENIVAQRFVRGVGDEGPHHLDIARHQIDADGRSHAKPDGDVNAGKNQCQQDHDDQDHFAMAEHRWCPDQCAEGLAGGASSGRIRARSASKACPR